MTIWVKETEVLRLREQLEQAEAKAQAIKSAYSAMEAQRDLYSERAHELGQLLATVCDNHCHLTIACCDGCEIGQIREERDCEYTPETATSPK